MDGINAGSLTLDAVKAICEKQEDCTSDCLFFLDTGMCAFTFPEPALWKLPEELELHKTEMNENRPRICDLLGVDVNEAFKFATPNRIYDKVYINDAGTMWAITSTGYTHKVGGQSVCWIINHPEAVNKLPPKPRLTDSELAICKAVGARWVTRDERALYVDLWMHKPERAEGESGAWYYDEDLLCSVKSDLLPSVLPGDCAEVDTTDA